MESTWTPEDWLRLADHVRSARDARGLTQLELAADAGVGLRTVQYVEGARGGRMPTKMPRLERALGWQPGSTRAILDGGSPTPTWPARPRHMPAEEKAVVKRYLEQSTAISGTAKRAILEEIAALPEAPPPEEG